MTEPSRENLSFELIDVSATRLPPDPPEAVAELERALAASAEDAAGRHAALREVAARWPRFVDAWAQLGASAEALGQDVEAFAFYRTAYHRGLDQLRANGWRGSGLVPWSHEPNRGVLRAVYGLIGMSALLGEVAEVERCRLLLLGMDPTDPLGAAPRQDRQ